MLRNTIQIMEPTNTDKYTEDSRQVFKDRSKSPLRLKYEAEVQVIKNKLGDLEEIRQKLGLSQRKICQLLMVDPSAWTRWTKNHAEAPPHIYRSLQWYMALNEKYPDLNKAYWLQSVARVHSSESPTHSWNIEKHLLKKQVIEELEKHYEFTPKNQENSGSFDEVTTDQQELKKPRETFAVKIQDKEFISLEADETHLETESVDPEHEEIKNRFRKLFDQDFISGAVFVGFILLSLFILLYRHIF